MPCALPVFLLQHIVALLTVVVLRSPALFVAARPECVNLDMLLQEFNIVLPENLEWLIKGIKSSILITRTEYFNKLALNDANLTIGCSTFLCVCITCLNEYCSLTRSKPPS